MLPEDGPPNVPNPPEPENSTRKTDPSPVSEPLAAEPDLTAVMAAIKASDERVANWMGSFRQLMRSELETVFGTLSQAIGDSEKRVIDTMQKEFASLDRSMSNEIGKVRGALGELAKDVRAHREVIGEHLTVSTEIRDRGYELQQSAIDDEQTEDRDTQVDIAEAGQ